MTLCTLLFRSNSKKKKNVIYSISKFSRNEIIDNERCRCFVVVGDFNHKIVCKNEIYFYNTKQTKQQIINIFRLI